MFSCIAIVISIRHTRATKHTNSLASSLLMDYLYSFPGFFCLALDDVAKEGGIKNGKVKTTKFLIFMASKPLHYYKTTSLKDNAPVCVIKDATLWLYAL